MFRSKALRIPLGVVMATAAMGASTALAADRYIATNGSDTANDCSSSAAPCLTLQYTLDQAAAGDTVHFAAGTYVPLEPGPGQAPVLYVRKTLTLLGAQAGVDARNRVGAETILSVPNGIHVTASNVVFDGFTIQDSAVQPFMGYGILLYNHGDITIPPVDGTRIVNNIFQDNIAGIGLSNAGATQTVIQHNLFQNNNLPPGPASGTGIYTDEYVGGSVDNVLIDSNTFTDQSSAAIGFNSQDPALPTLNITISNNTIDECARGVSFYNTQNATVTGNTITNTNVAPIDGGTATTIGIFGGNSNITIDNNDLEAGIGFGIRIGDFLAPNSRIQVHDNNIVGFVLAGVQIDDLPLDSPRDLTCNWWGDPSGPTNPANPGGTGDVLAGDFALSDFKPWLLGPEPDAQCQQLSCVVDSDCAAGNFCDTSSFMCTPQLSSGKPIPTIPGHEPPLDGTCTEEVGAIVCVSGVCDTSDDLCGFAFGHPCTASPECRSNNCNMDTGLCDLPCCGNTYGGGDCVICEDAGPGNDAGTDANADASDASGDATPGNTPADGTPQIPGNAGNGSPAQPSGNGNSSSGGGCQMGGGASNADFATLAGMLAMTVGAVRRRRTARS